MIHLQNPHVLLMSFALALFLAGLGCFLFVQARKAWAEHRLIDEQMRALRDGRLRLQQANKEAKREG